MKQFNNLKHLLLLVGLLLTSAAFAQQRVTGQVSDEAGTPLIGVNVLEVGTSNGTVTDLDGNYSLQVGADAQLAISYTGYQAQQLAVNNQSVINVTMVEGAVLDEVVVIGYGTEKKINLTGSVATIGTEELTAVPVASTSGLLTGRFPGVITNQSSGLPGSDATTIRIRGFAGEPLVLVDGVQVSGGLDRIDPNDIESISVLKDASAAVYGSRAGNGVILVTTKRGKAGPPQLSYDGSFTVQEATSFLEPVGAADLAQLMREADLLDTGDADATFTAEDVENYRVGAPGYEGGDWRNALIDNFAPMQQHSLKASGGSDHVRYFTSVGYTQQESYFRSRDYDYNRFNARSNIDVSVNENLSFQIDLSYRVDNRDRAAGDVNTIFNELGTAQSTEPTELPDPDFLAWSGFLQRQPIALSTRDIVGFRDRRDDTFRGKLGLSYKIPFIEGMRLRTEINTELLQQSIKTFRKPFEVFDYEPSSGAYISQGTSGAVSTVSDYQFRRQQIYPLIALEYNRNFGDHDFKFLALAEQITRKESSVSAQRNDLLTTAIPELFTGSQDFQFANGGSFADIGRKSVVGRLNYSFKNRYLFEAAFRADGNVLFAPQTRWGYFPSFSAGWVISREPFMAGSNLFDNLKVRASYSQLGDDSANGLNGFDYLTGYQQGGIYILGNNASQPRISTLGLANPALTWEEITLYNFGLEASFLEGRLRVEADVFYRNREGLLGQNLRDIPSTFGANLPLVNLNSRNNRGIEMMVAYQQRIGEARLTISPNFTFARAKWGDVFDQEDFDDPDQLRINGRSGQWVNRNFGYATDGIFMSQEEIDGHPIDQDQAGNSTLRPGDIKYIDQNGDGVIDFRDQEVIAFADGNPELVYGLSLGFTYKNFGISTLLQGASRFSIRISGNAQTMFSNFSTPLVYHRDLRWQPDPNDPTVNINPNAALPAATTSPGANNSRNNDIFRRDVTYLRLKNVNIYYNLPTGVTSRVGISNVQLYAAGLNLFTVSSLGIFKNSFDPEEATAGNPSRNIPITRNFTGGLRITF
ncbi:SusC/RagA family TonB-linked outer membrane protein [Flavilitoribacter nigricans]|uniref:SusC/RagA family TonB-linked outer membrane protein n=1 Tax=Flavilitoribacter nigricans (strain ATCC 23147 / DSM 23189 / NBRC 102662 / NCIMB 1420 / SS-2) TaxID=1122177 RepID=A0A2D0N7R2_FLAN2|nr:TonB-dependent receptor [Flavilitoribacter nigricans]PHN04554.1 SusC/RagA family TonB-linked outer membrane protein [Flavilitoribacter nigricans DSM 23189 = NBRC 102662]